MSDYDISVIVPVYNACGFLAQSLGNLLNQTKKGIQIILVNDASTDESLKICQDAKGAFGDRIEIIDLPQNGGPGAARNVGLDAALGDYIGFMDSDDLVDPTMYEKLFDSITRSDADICDGAFFRQMTGQASIHFPDEYCGMLDDKIKSALIVSGGFIVTKLFKRDILKDIRFRPVYGLEDLDFLIEIIAKAGKVSNCMDIVYNYRDNMSSLSKNMDFREFANRHLTAMEGVYNRVSNLPVYPGIQDACEFIMMWMYRQAVNQTIISKSSDDDKACLDVLYKARAMRKEYIKGSFTENPYVPGQIEKSDIDVMKMNDANPKRVLRLAKPV